MRGANVLNWRHERYCWVPREALDVFATVSFDARALVTYLAKYANTTGVVRVAKGPVSTGIARLIAMDPSDRREFNHVVKEAIANGLLIVDETNGVVEIPLFVGWQDLKESKEKKHRLFARETPRFAALSAYARMYAAEFVRTADDGGVVTTAPIAALVRVLSDGRGGAMHSTTRAAYVARLHHRFNELCAEGFMVDDGAGVRIRNFVEAQETRAQQDARRTGIPTPAKALVALAPIGGHADTPPTSGSVAPDVCGMSDGATEDTSSLQVPVTKRINECIPSVSKVPNLSKEEEKRDSLRSLVRDVFDTAERSPSNAMNPTSTIPYNAHPLGANVQLPLIADPSQTATDAPAVPARAAKASTPTKPTKNARDATAKGSAAKTEKAPKAKKELADGPMPFYVPDALAAIEKTARGRFVIGNAKMWKPYTNEHITARIRRFPEIEMWTAMGEWLANNWREAAKTPNWLRLNDFDDKMILAMDEREKRQNYAGPATVKPPLHVVESETYVDPDRDPSITNENFDVNRRVADPFTTGKHANARRA